MTARLRLIALSCALLMPAACSDADPNLGSVDSTNLPTPSGLGNAGGRQEYHQQADLEGRFVTRINIVGDEWKAGGPNREVSLTLEVEGLYQARQFELVLHPLPADAFDLTSAAFSLAAPPWTFSPGTQVSEDGKLRIGGASLGFDVQGTQRLGVVTLKTSASFSSATEASIGVLFFSVGPSSQERDNFEADQLNLGVHID